MQGKGYEDAPSILRKFNKFETLVEADIKMAIINSDSASPRDGDSGCTSRIGHNFLSQDEIAEK